MPLKICSHNIVSRKSLDIIKQNISPKKKKMNAASTTMNNTTPVSMAPTWRMTPPHRWGLKSTSESLGRSVVCYKKSFSKEEVKQPGQGPLCSEAHFWSTPSSAQVDSGKQLTKTKYGILKLKLRVALNLFGGLGSKGDAIKSMSPFAEKTSGQR